MPEIDNTTLVERIKETAKKRSTTIKEVSLKAGLGEKTITNWRHHAPQSDKLRAVADVLNVSSDYLLGHDDTPNKKVAIEDVSITHKLRTEGLNEEQLQKVDDYIEFLKYEYLKDVQKYDQ